MVLKKKKNMGVAKMNHYSTYNNTNIQPTTLQTCKDKYKGWIFSLCICLILLIVLQVAHGIIAAYLDLFVNLAVIVITMVLIRRHPMFAIALISIISKIGYEIYRNSVPANTPGKDMILLIYSFIIDFTIIICIISIMLCCKKKIYPFVISSSTFVIICIAFLISSKVASERAFNEMFDNSDFYNSEEAMIPESWTKLENGDLSETEIIRLTSKMIKNPEEFGFDMLKDTPMFKAIKKANRSMIVYAIAYIFYAVSKILLLVVICITPRFVIAKVYKPEKLHQMSQKMIAKAIRQSSPGNKALHIVLTVLSEIGGAFFLIFAVGMYSYGSNLKQRMTLAYQEGYNGPPLEFDSYKETAMAVDISYTLTIIFLILTLFLVIFPIVQGLRRRRLLKNINGSYSNSHIQN